MSPALLRTGTGRDVDLGAPDPSAISIRDVAQHLSRINRFLGATHMPYSVAQHALLVARIAGQMLRASPEEQLLALLHDAHEAYLGDMTRPAYRALREPARHDVDGMRLRLDRAIWEAFGLEWRGMPELVNEADDIALATEWRDLMPGPALAPAGRCAPWPVRPMPGWKAESQFLQQFEQLHRAAGLVAGPSGQLLR